MAYKTLPKQDPGSTSRTSYPSSHLLVLIPLTFLCGQTSQRWCFCLRAFERTFPLGRHCSKLLTTWASVPVRSFLTTYSATSFVTVWKHRTSLHFVYFRPPPPKATYKLHVFLPQSRAQRSSSISVPLINQGIQDRNSRNVILPISVVASEAAVLKNLAVNQPFLILGKLNVVKETSPLTPYPVLSLPSPSKQYSEMFLCGNYHSC